MRRNRDIILAIRPGTRVLHYQVTVDGEMVEESRKHFKGVWSKEKLSKILHAVEALRLKYRPNMVVMKMPHPGRRGEELSKLIRNLALSLCRKKM